jgi:hypothetical protein
MGYKYFCLDGRAARAESEVMAIALASGLLLVVNPGSHGITRHAGRTGDAQNMGNKGLYTDFLLCLLRSRWCGPLLKSAQTGIGAL